MVLFESVCALVFFIEVGHVFVWIKFVVFVSSSSHATDVIRLLTAVLYRAIFIVVGHVLLLSYLRMQSKASFIFFPTTVEEIPLELLFLHYTV